MMLNVYHMQPKDSTGILFSILYPQRPLYKILNLDYDCNITEELKTVIGSIIEYGKRQNFNGELFVLFSNDPH